MSAVVELLVIYLMVKTEFYVGQNITLLLWSTSNYWLLNLLE